MSRNSSDVFARRSGRFRHVVFADALNGSGRALNFAPDDSDQCAPIAMESDESAFVHWLFRETGLDARDYRAESLRRRLPACLRTLRVGNVSQARAVLERTPILLEAAVSALLIGVTSFFRDTAVFDILADLLPELLARNIAAHTRRPLRIWSAACSDGAELYSVAMLLAELNVLDEESSADRILLLGTDCRTLATRTASAGLYAAASLRGISAERLSRHFDRVTDASETGLGPTGGWRIRPMLARCTHWRTGNMLEMTEPGAWDLILCRNAAMYMKSGTATLLWQHFESSLAPGGYLVLGKAERPVGTTRLSSVAPCVYRSHAH